MTSFSHAIKSACCNTSTRSEFTRTTGSERIGFDIQHRLEAVSTPILPQSLVAPSEIAPESSAYARLVSSLLLWPTREARHRFPHMGESIWQRTPDTNLSHLRKRTRPIPFFAAGDGSCQEPGRTEPTVPTRYIHRATAKSEE
jgi:hypothetical protein